MTPSDGSGSGVPRECPNYSSHSHTARPWINEASSAVTPTVALFGGTSCSRVLGYRILAARTAFMMLLQRIEAHVRLDLDRPCQTGVSSLVLKCSRFWATVPQDIRTGTYCGPRGRSEKIPSTSHNSQRDSRQNTLRQGRHCHGHYRRSGSVPLVEFGKCTFRFRAAFAMRLPRRGTVRSNTRLQRLRPRMRIGALLQSRRAAGTMTPCPSSAAVAAHCLRTEF